jgi:hypothetical protein
MRYRHIGGWMISRPGWREMRIKRPGLATVVRMLWVDGRGWITEIYRPQLRRHEFPQRGAANAIEAFRHVRQIFAGPERGDDGVLPSDALRGVHAGS